jgi:plasmid stabilization system protein ParE
MRLKWQPEALHDLARLHAFLAPENPRAATQTLRSLRVAATELLRFPRVGQKLALTGYESRELRRIIIGRYEMRYEIKESTLYVLRVFHTREDR